MDESNHSFIVWSVMIAAHPSTKRLGGGRHVTVASIASRFPVEPSLLEFSANSIACSPVTCENETSFDRTSKGPCDASDGQEFGVGGATCQQQSRTRFLFRKFALGESQQNTASRSAKNIFHEPSSLSSTCNHPIDTVRSPHRCRSMASLHRS